MTVQELYENIGASYDSAKRIMMMDKLITKFILKFLDDGSYAKLSAAFDAGDATAMFEGAHALKGVSANLGLDDLSAAASAVAEEFRPGNARTMDDAALAAKMDEIRALYERSIEGIRQFAAEQ